MDFSSLREQMRVVVARPLTGDIRSDVGKTGTVVKMYRRWAEVVLDGEFSLIRCGARELEPLETALRASESDEQSEGIVTLGPEILRPQRRSEAV